MHPVVIDGFTQPGAQPNTNPTGGLNAVLKIELDRRPGPTRRREASSGAWC